MTLPVKKRLSSLLLLLAVFGLPVHAQDRFSDKALVDALRAGGYTLYFRHAATDWSNVDQVSNPGDWKSCDPQRMRQLSEQGRKDARRIGSALRRLSIPVGRVLSSEYCRTLQTAQAMEIGAVATSRDIMNLRVAAYLGGRDALVERARKVLATPPEKNTNTVLVAHGNLIRAASGAYPGEAGAVVFASRGDGNFPIVALLTPDDWDRLAREYAQAP